MTDAELLRALDHLRSIMISVSTGGPPIKTVEDEFRDTYDQVAEELANRGIDNPLPYRDLWQWYGRWSSGDLPTYASRRAFIADLVDPVIGRLRTGASQPFVVTGWQRVDRTVTHLRQQLAKAETEEQFQAVGLLCREALISLAQAVFKPDEHPTLDGVAASDTDAKRMLEAYIAASLSGGSNEHVRKHARAALGLALHIQHKRTAAFRDAALCSEATTSVINQIAILAGRRNPQTDVQSKQRLLNEIAELRIRVGEMRIEMETFYRQNQFQAVDWQPRFKELERQIASRIEQFASPAEADLYRHRGNLERPISPMGGYANPLLVDMCIRDLDHLDEFVRHYSRQKESKH
jgi:hypothetical protein